MKFRLIGDLTQFGQSITAKFVVEVSRFIGKANFPKIRNPPAGGNYFSNNSVKNVFEILEDLDDVQNVYTNAEFPEDFVQE